MGNGTSQGAEAGDRQVGGSTRDRRAQDGNEQRKPEVAQHHADCRSDVAEHERYEADADQDQQILRVHRRTSRIIVVEPVMKGKPAVSVTGGMPGTIRWIAGLEILSWSCLFPNRGRTRRFASSGIIKKENGLQLVS